MTRGDETGETFGAIYESAAWGGGSGEGSCAAATDVYRAIVERLARGSDVSSVVDAGCGDWEFSQLVDWGDVSYLGLDVVPELVARNREAFARPRVEFQCSDFHAERPPVADLLLCKDVLQHWPVAWIQRFLRFTRGRYRYMLLTNDIDSSRPSHPRNSDIELGDWRPVDLEAAVFGLRATWRLDYDVGGEWTKRTLLIVPLRHRLGTRIMPGSGLRAVRRLGVR
jgi:SAM-dependent methyltransferase